MILDLQESAGPSTSVAYFYGDASQPLENNSTKLFATLIAQALTDVLDHEEPRKLPSKLVKAYERSSQFGRAFISKVDSPMEILAAVASATKSFMVVVDGLDEMSEPEATVRQLMQASSMFGPGFQLAILSRDSKDLMRCLEGTAHLSIRSLDVRPDIETYIQERAQRLPLEDDVSRQNLVKVITDKVDGMFLWAHVVMQDLETATTISDVEDMLLRCPPGLAATYDRFFLGLASQPAHRRRTARELLQWVLCAFRPLSISELEHALSVQSPERRSSAHIISTDHTVFRAAITEICHPFLCINPGGDQIRPIHHSFREYLTAANSSVQGMASEFFIGARSHTELALKCLEYIGLRPSQSGKSFWGYAMTSWCHHTTLGSYDSGLEMQVCRFLSTKANRQKWLYWMLFEYREPFAFTTIFKWQECLEKWASASPLESGLNTSLVENDWSMDVLELLLGFLSGHTRSSYDHLSSTSYFDYREEVTYFEKMMVVRGLARRLNRKNRLAEAVQLLEQRSVTADLNQNIFLVNILGVLLDQQGLTELALEKHREAQSTQELLHGGDHLETLWSTNEIGRMYRHLGLLKESELMHRHSLTKLMMNLPEDHSEITWTINTLATTLRLQNRLDEALKLHLQAYHSRERCLGALHAHTLWSCGDVAKCFRDLHLFDSALVWYQKTLDGRLVALGSEHADTLWSMNNLGSIRQALGDVDQALVLQKQALEAQERILGRDHAHTCWTRQVIANLMG